MKRFGALACLLLAACGSEPNALGSPASAIPAASPTAAPSVPAPTPSPEPSAGLALACKLPVVLGGEAPTAGFLSFPGGHFTVDPTGDFSLDAGKQLYRSVAQPGLYGPQKAAFYDRVLSRWLPVQRTSVSPDAARYGFVQAGAGWPQRPAPWQVHIVDIRSGADRAFTLPGSASLIGWGVVAFSAEGVYLNHQPYEPPTLPGLWLLDLRQGTVQQVFADKVVAAVGAGSAWLTDTNPDDPHPAISPYYGGPLPNELLRRDLKSGATSGWFYQPGASVTLLGFDPSGHPLVSVLPSERSSPEIWMLAAAGQATALVSGPAQGFQGVQAWADGHGIWIAGNFELFLYANGALRPAAPGSLTVAGDCG